MSNGTHPRRLALGECERCDLWQTSWTGRLAGRRDATRADAPQGDARDMPQNIAKELDPGGGILRLGPRYDVVWLGDQIARVIEPEAGLTQQLAGQLHPRRTRREAAGLLVRSPPRRRSPAGHCLGARTGGRR